MKSSHPEGFMTQCVKVGQVYELNSYGDIYHVRITDNTTGIFVKVPIGSIWRIGESWSISPDWKLIRYTDSPLYKVLENL